MSKLYLTAVFHCNLNYSSIPVEKRKEVIDTCYWPFLRMAEKTGIKLGFEFSGNTLEIINELDASFLDKIKKLWQADKIEIIGSGYIQSIFSLIPAEVNMRNLELGNQAYVKLLGKQPSVAFVNEQTYSAGIVELYKKAGYKAIIIDWPNANKYNEWPTEKQYACGFLNGCGEKISVIWNNCVAFQKLQRYAYGNLSLSEYVNYVMNNYSDKKDRCFMIYGNDAEIYNFRVRDLQKLLHAGGIRHDEIKRIEEAFEELKKDRRVKFITPSECLVKNPPKEEFKIETAQYPIISKKQDKYNVTRWAVCGKENHKSNSLCYEAYYLLKELGKEKKNKAKPERQELWKNLVIAWASDFRTFTDDNKWDAFRKELLGLIDNLRKEAKKHNLPVDKAEIYDKTEIHEQNAGTKAKKESGNKLLRIENNLCIVETEKILLEINKSKGGTIKRLVFKDICDKPLIKLLPHGYFEDVSYSADFFSGHTIAFNGREKITDLSSADISFKQEKHGVRIITKNKMNDSIPVTKEYYIPFNDARVDVSLEFDIKIPFNPLNFRCFNLTVNPEAFERASLCYETVNGGFKKEFFPIPIKSDVIKQSSPVELNITSRHCLGATNGWLSIGDKSKRLVIMTNKAVGYTVPLIDYEKLRDKYFFRVENSLCETDETARTELNGKIQLFFSISAKVI